MSDKKIVILDSCICCVRGILHNLKGDEAKIKTSPVLNIPTPNRKERRKLKRSNKLGK